MRGLHRRHRVLRRRGAPRGRDVRHRPRRGPLPRHAQLRQADRARLRRRRRRAERRGERLPVGADPRGRGVGRAGSRPARTPRTSRGPTRARSRTSVVDAVPFLQFRLDAALAGADVSTPEGRARAAERALAVIVEHPSDLVRDQYVMQVADRCRLDPTLLRDDVARQLRTGTVAPAATRPRRDGAATAGRRGPRGPRGAAPRAARAERPRCRGCRRSCSSTRSSASPTRRSRPARRTPR